MALKLELGREGGRLMPVGKVLGLAGRRRKASLPPSPPPTDSFLHSAVLLQAVGGEAAVGPAAALHTAAAAAQFAASLPALRQRLHEEREGGEQVAEAGQVEGAVVGLRVVVQEACEGQAGREEGNTKKVRPSTHFLEVLESIPAVNVTSPSWGYIQIQTTSFRVTNSPTVHVWDCGRNLVRTHAATGRTCKLQAEKPHSGN